VEVIALPAEDLEERLRGALRHEAEKLMPSPDSWEQLQRRARRWRARRMAGGMLGFAVVLCVAALAWGSLHARDPRYLVGPSVTATTARPAVTSAPALRGLELTVTPPTVRRGDTIQVAPLTPCVPPAGAPAPTVSVWIVDSAGNDLGVSRFPVNPDGTWLGAYSVGSWAPRGEATVHALCRSGAGPDSPGYGSYDPGVHITLTD
jgi:hypothetical protein